MSRVGKRILEIPEQTNVEVKDQLVTISGKLGKIAKTFSPLINIEVKDQKVSTFRINELKHTKQLHGTTNSLLSGMLIGVSKGFEKEIEIKGVGYKAALKGENLEVIAGYSHPVIIPVINGVKIELIKPTQLKISGIDKQKVGQMAAVIRQIRRPNPYTGKGIMYKGEQIIRKEGKSATK